MGHPFSSFGVQGIGLLEDCEFLFPKPFPGRPRTSLVDLILPLDSPLEESEKEVISIRRQRTDQPPKTFAALHRQVRQEKVRSKIEHSKAVL